MLYSYVEYERSERRFCTAADREEIRFASGQTVTGIVASCGHPIFAIVMFLVFLLLTEKINLFFF